ncbi:hypothetical protein A5778_05490 [Mycolicibacterium monacense]|nr:hypothetical protein A5778_05490 [Mycolicibacterium monacense]
MGRCFATSASDGELRLAKGEQNLVKLVPDFLHERTRIIPFSGVSHVPRSRNFDSWTDVEVIPG